MTKDHTDAKRKLEDVEGKATLAPSSTDLSENLKQQASDEATRLGGLTGKTFDRAYIDAQVSDHAALLRELDQDLIPEAKDHGLAALLRKLRPTVAHHLALARKLQSELAGGTP
jgi:putative membrane protein